MSLALVRHSILVLQKISSKREIWKSKEEGGSFHYLGRHHHNSNAYVLESIDMTRGGDERTIWQKG